jgi:hypothetical protein
LSDGEDADSDGYWWWQSKEAKSASWVVPAASGSEGRADRTVKFDSAWNAKMLVIRPVKILVKNIRY